MDENYQETYDCDSVFESSSETSENTLIELNEGSTYSSEEAFIFTIRAYAKQEGFQVRLGKSEKNSAGQTRKRTIVCSREGSPDKPLNNLSKKIKLININKK